MANLSMLKSEFDAHAAELCSYKEILSDTHGRDQITAQIIDDLVYTTARLLIEDGIEPAELRAQELVEHVKGYVSLNVDDLSWADVNNIDDAIKSSVYQNQLSKDKQIPLRPLSKAVHFALS